MEIAQYIEINPKIMMGKPVIKGTRITVESILLKLSAAETMGNIIEAHPHITKEQIQAALVFAAESLKGDMIYPVAI